MKHFNNEEFKRGWHVLILAIVGVATSSSSLLLYSFSSMVIPLEQAMGWARSDLQAAITALSLGTIVAAQLAGWLNLRYGLRAVTLVSLVVLSLSLFMLAHVGGSIWMLYLGFFLVPLAGVGTLQITWSHLVNLWFEENRGFALAIILSGSGLAAIMLPLITSWAIGRWNWQAGFIALGLLPVLLALPLALRWLVPVVAVGDARAQAPMAEVERHPGILLRDALGSWRFWICNLSMTLVVACVVGMVTNIVPMLQGKGLSAQAASQVFSSFGISIIAGRLLVGYLLDRYPPILVAVISLALPAIGCVIFLFAGVQSMALLVLATLCIGASAGAEFDLAAFLMARYFGLREYARIFGLHLALITIVSGLMPVFFGYLYEAYDGYSAVLLCCLACSIIGPSILLWLRPAAVVTVQQQHA